MQVSALPIATPIQEPQQVPAQKIAKSNKYDDLLRKYNIPSFSEFKIKFNYEYDTKALEEANCILIRHALSEFNFKQKVVDYEKLSYIDDKQKVDRLQKEYKTSQNYVDAELHEIGVIQSQNQQQQANTLNIEHVFMSPMHRVLQTVQNIFINHPNKQNIKFVIIPELSESMGYSPSITLETDVYIKEFEKNMNVKVDRKLLKSGDLLWNIKQMTNKVKQQKILEDILKDIKEEDLTKEVFLNRMLQNYQANYPTKTENKQDIFDRGNMAKQQIRNYLSQSKRKNSECSTICSSDSDNESSSINNYKQQSQVINNKSKICIAAHNIFLNCFTAERISEDQQVIGGVVCQNAQLIPYKFQYSNY